MNRSLVVLLRRRASPDPYEEALVEAGFDVDFAPVLEFEFLNGDTLRARLDDPDPYEAMIVTSRRALEAVAAQGGVGQWAGRPVYAVGPSTAGMAAEMGFDVWGGHAPSAELLADTIIKDHPKGPLLFLCGNRRLDTLPKTLREAGIQVDELVVYETNPVPPKSIPTAADWAVFFSPSGVEAALTDPEFPWNHLRTAAIGPTTAAALRECSHPPSAVAADPTPGGLVAALQGA